LIWQRTVASQMADARIAARKIIGQCRERAHASVRDHRLARGLRRLAQRPTRNPSAKRLPAEIARRMSPLKLVSIDQTEKQNHHRPDRYTEAGSESRSSRSAASAARPRTRRSARPLRTVATSRREGAHSSRPTPATSSPHSWRNTCRRTSATHSLPRSRMSSTRSRARAHLREDAHRFLQAFSQGCESPRESSPKPRTWAPPTRNFKCPKCGATPMEIKLGRNGKFLSMLALPGMRRRAHPRYGHEFRKTSRSGRIDDRLADSSS